MIQIKAAGMTRISKRHAARLYNQGKTVYLLPCKLHPASPWACPAGVQRRPGSNRTLEDFSARYSHYNCNAETGRYPAYYVSDADL